MIRPCVSRPAPPSFTALCLSEPASMWLETWTPVSKRNQVQQPQFSDQVTVRSIFTCVSLLFLTYRNKFRLHQGVSPQYWDVAAHQTHVTQRSLQNSVRSPAHRQLSTVPPAVEPGHVPGPSVTLWAPHSTCARCFCLPAVRLGLGLLRTLKYYIG